MRREAAELHLQWQASEQWSYPIDRPSYRFKVSDVDDLYQDFSDRGGVIEGASQESADFVGELQRVRTRRLVDGNGHGVFVAEHRLRGVGRRAQFDARDVLEAHDFGIG